MKSYILCKNKETLISLRLSGIEGKVLDYEKDLKDEIEKLISDKDIGIIILSEDLVKNEREYIMNKKLEEKNTLIIQIPEPGSPRQTNYIMKYIKDSMGVKL